MGAGMSPDTKGPSRLSVFSVIINVTCGILGQGSLASRMRWRKLDGCGV